MKNKFYKLKYKFVKLIAGELTKTVKENMTHAWYEKAQAQAKMRSVIKRLLKKYDYPPNKSKHAIESVLEQAKLQCANL